MKHEEMTEEERFARRVSGEGDGPTELTLSLDEHDPFTVCENINRILAEMGKKEHVTVFEDDSTRTAIIKVAEQSPARTPNRLEAREQPNPQYYRSLLWPSTLTELLRQGDAAAVEQYIERARQKEAGHRENYRGEPLPAFSEEDWKQFDQDAAYLRRLCTIVPSLYNDHTLPPEITCDIVGEDPSVTIMVDSSTTRDKLTTILQKEGVSARILTPSTPMLQEHVVASGMCDRFVYFENPNAVQSSLSLTEARHSAKKVYNKDVSVVPVFSDAELTTFVQELKSATR